MKELSAVKFRIILYVALFVMTAAIVGAFLFGYRYLQTVGEDTKKRQVDAVASEDSISKLQSMKVELESKASVTDKLASLRSTNTLPQFDTEKSLRTIAGQLGLSVSNITFVDGGGGGAASQGATPAATQQTTSQTGTGSAQATQSSGSWGGSRNSRISFEFSGSISYDNFIRFLEAIETATPKLRIESVNIPSGSSRSSVDPGTLTLEMATM